jgi:predicted lipoprotein with Yx(FWY)xxD motif
MPDASYTQPRPESRPARRRLAALLAAIAALALVAIATATALAVRGARAHAAATTRVVDAAPVASLGKTVAVTVHGRTLYALHPETVHHLRCKSRACLEVWPPLLVHSARVKLGAGAGVSGRLGLIRRGAHSYQVTLRGLPLYRFSGDGAKGEANGEGIESFGGTWHAVTAAPSAAATPATPTPTPTPMPMPPPTPTPYGY